MASWYGAEFHGKTTSNKEIYDMYDMTAAHNTLPFGTYVMVTNLDNGKSTIVRINDRGPFIEDRIIDLSYAAAKVLDMIDSGTAPVRIEVLEYFASEKPDQKFSVQVGAFIFKDNAKALKSELQEKYKNVYISLFETSNQTYYRVRVKASDWNSAQKIAQRLLDDGYTVIVLEEE
jgi:rare lipoprotein A